jgi:hypothetical protein
MNKPTIAKFLGWTGSDARFDINVHLANFLFGVKLERIIVAHEGDWTNWDNPTRTYEAVQEQLGYGLKFISKEYSKLLDRTLFSYSIVSSNYVVLAVPATGEEIYFEIYGADEWQRGLYLLESREL